MRCIIGICLLLAACSQPQPMEVNLIPKPQSLEFQEGMFVLNHSTASEVDERFHKELSYFQFLTGLPLQGEKNKLILSLEKKILSYQKCVFKNNKKVRQKGLCFKKFKIVKKAYLELKRDESVKMEYFTGNIYQTLGNEKEATKSYKLAIKKSVAHKLDFKKNREYLKKALLDLIKIQLKLPKKRELLWSLKIFLNYFPHHNLSLSFHKKMFTLHYQLGHDREVERNFEDFRKKYPGQKAIITKMVNQILNKLILKKKADKLEFWVKKIKKEKIEVPKETFKNVLGHLASFLFTKYQKMEDEGRFKESKKGFYRMISGGLFSKVVVIVVVSTRT